MGDGQLDCCRPIAVYDVHCVGSLDGSGHADRNETLRLVNFDRSSIVSMQ
jgi:hypothetical protein